MRIVAFMLACIAVVIFPAVSPAQTTRPADQKSAVELITSADAVVAGQSFTVALRFEIEPNWHIYYKEPGDSGMEPRVKWKLPEGFVATQVEHPTPRKLETSAGVNWVHAGPVVLLARISAPAGVQTSEAAIQADLRWLVCDDDQCIAQRQSVSVSLPVRASASPVREKDFAEWQTLVDQARSFDTKSK